MKEILTFAIIVAVVAAAFFIWSRRAKAAPIAAFAGGGVTPCMDPTYSISGRTVTHDGIGLRAVRVYARRYEDGMSWSGLSDAFGNFRFNIPNCGVYIVAASATKSHIFPDDFEFTLPSDQFQDGRTFDFFAQ